MSGITRDEWLRALDEAGVGYVDDQDSVTVEEYRRMFTPPLHRMTATRHLLALVEAGKAIQTQKRVCDAGSRKQTIRSFKLLKTEKASGRNRSR